MKLIKGCLGMIVLSVIGFICIGIFASKNMPSTSTSTATRVVPDRLGSTAEYTSDTKETAELTSVQITFSKLPDTEAEAASIVRQEMTKAIAKDGSKEILAMAFDTSDNALAEEKYGGPIRYSPKDKTIKTMREQAGLNSQTQSRSDYSVKIDEEGTYPGIVPARRWLTLSLVFSQAPSAEKFKAAARTEISKLKSRRVDIAAYGFAGDSGNSATWQQVRSTSGHYMVANFTAVDGATVFK